MGKQREAKCSQTSRWFRQLAGCALLCGGLAGCTTTLIVEGEFPEPLVKPLPITAGLHISDAFRDYTYQEDSDDRDKWIILLGEVQTDLFNTVLPNLFNQFQRIDQAPPWQQPPAVDLVIVPSVDEFQYALPSETHINVFEVWLKYRVQVYTPGGELLADWIVTAYGKTPDGFLQSNEAALNQAIIVALRDAGANLSLNFSRVPEIRNWLNQLPDNQS